MYVISYKLQSKLEQYMPFINQGLIYTSYTSYIISIDNNKRRTGRMLYLNSSYI